MCAGSVGRLLPSAWGMTVFDSADVCSRRTLDSNFLTRCEKRSTPQVHTSSSSSINRAETQKIGLSFCINPRRFPQRPSLTAIRSTDNDFLLLRSWWEGRPQRCKMHLLSELIDAGSQFVIKRRENGCLLNLQLCLGAWLWQSSGGQHGSFKACEEEETEGFLFALFIFWINCFYTVTISLKGLYIRLWGLWETLPEKNKVKYLL